MNPKEMDLYQIVEAAAKAGYEWANAQADYDHEERITKTILAEVMNQYKGEKTSFAEAERNAIQDKYYLEHLLKVKTAREKALKHKIKYEKWSNFVQAKIMEISVSKVEKKLI